MDLNNIFKWDGGFICIAGKSNLKPESIHTNKINQKSQDKEDLYGRLLFGTTITGLAKKIGASVSQLEDYLVGKRYPEDIWHIKRWAKEIDLDYHVLKLILRKKYEKYHSQYRED